MTMHFSPQQAQAAAAVRKWLNGKSQVFRLFGYAGTGKTTIARTLAETVSGKVEFAAFTGKAALVMQRAGCEGARTIHSLIYRARDKADGNPDFSLNRSSPMRNAVLAVIDEVSMVGDQVGRDLLAFGKKVLVLGDPAQLPPVEGGGFFTKVEPDVLLTEVHRQAEGNPILELATMAREGQRIPNGDYGDSRVIARRQLQDSDLDEASIVICGVNNFRRSLNRRIRNLKGFGRQMPMRGDRLVCMRNDHATGMLNGSMWIYQGGSLIPGHTVLSDVLQAELTSDDDPNHVVHVNVPSAWFTAPSQEELGDVKRMFPGHAQMDYGYAITCHKAQGSQFEAPLIFNDSFVFKDDAPRWLYTAITRAVDRVTIVR